MFVTKIDFRPAPMTLYKIDGAAPKGRHSIAGVRQLKLTTSQIHCQALNVCRKIVDSLLSPFSITKFQTSNSFHLVLPERNLAKEIKD